MNGARVVEMELQPGDIIRIGESEFEVGLEQGNVETHNVRDTLIEKKAEVVERLRSIGSKRAFLYGAAGILVLLMGISFLKPRKKPMPVSPEKTGYTLPEVRVTPRNATADQILSWQSQANRALQFDDFRGAIPLLRNIVAARPNDLRSKSQLARAEAELAKLISEHFEAGAREFEKYDYDRAIREWRQSMALADGFDKEISKKAKAKIREAEEKLSK